MTVVVYNYINWFVDKLLALALGTNYSTNYSIIVIIVIIVIIIKNNNNNSSSSNNNNNNNNNNNRLLLQTFENGPISVSGTNIAK